MNVKQNQKKQEPPISEPKPALNPRVATIVCLSMILLLSIVFFHKVVLGVANFWEDLIYQELPHRLFARDCLLGLSFPHWNPYTFGGMPFFAATHTGVLYPSNLLLSFLPFGRGAFWYALELSIVLHVAIAGIAMFLLCRYARQSRLSSLFAAASYMLCGFFVVHIIHSLMLYMLAWLPLVMFFMLRGTSENRKKDFIYAGLILGATIFAGHPQITFYEFLFLGAYALYLLIAVSKQRLAHGILLFALFAVAGGLAMVLLLPAAELAKESARVTWTFQMASEGSISFRQLLTFLIPKLYGETTAPGSWREAVGFWLNEAYHSGYWTYWETTFYTGLSAFALGMVQLVNIRRSRFALFCGIWFAVSLFIALGSNFFVYRILFDYVPGFHTFRGPARILFTWNLLLPFLAARTIDDLLREDTRKRMLRPLLIAGGACLAVGLMAPLGMANAFAPELADGTLKTYAVKQSGTMIFILGLAAIAILLLYLRTIKHTHFAALMAAILCIDLFWFGVDYHIVSANSHYNPVTYFSRNKQLADYLGEANKNELFRTKMREGGIMLLDRNQGMMDKIFLMEGYNPLNLFRHIVPAAPQAQLDLFNVKYAIQIDSVRGAAGLVENSTYLPRARMVYRAVVLANDSLVKQYQQSPAFDHVREAVLIKEPGISLPADTTPVRSGVSVSKYRNNRIEISANTEKNGLLWLSEIWYPAWKAAVDGRPAEILRADYSFMAVPLEKGEHTVTIEFASKAFSRGLMISLLTLFAAIGAILIFSVMDRRTKKI